MCATFGPMLTAGLRELRQNASELVRRVEDGEEVTVTVSGRAVARLVGVDSRRWRRHRELAELFAGPADDAWGSDRHLIDHSLVDPFGT